MSIDRTQSRIAAFRVPELQECLERLGLKKTGRKAELQARLIALFSDSEALVSAGHVLKDQGRIDQCKRIVEDVYNKMTGMTGKLDGAPPKPSTTETQVQHQSSSIRSELNDRRQHSEAGPGPSSIHLKLQASTAAVAVAAQVVARSAARINTTIRCLCGSALGSRPGPTLKCQGETCGIWQHQLCIYQQPEAVDKKLLQDFYCESCRSSRADPFWDVVSHEVVPMATLKKTQKQVLVGTQYLSGQSLERYFFLQSSQMDQLKRRPQEYRLQVVCLQLDDPVKFRWHWPLLADLRVNDKQYRVYSRSSSTKLGTNQRDEAANIGIMCTTGRGKISLTCGDNRAFVMGVQFARRRSLEDVKGMMLSPLSLSDAVQEVKNQFGEDDDVVAVNTVMSLKDPLSGARIKTPARFKEKHGLVSFDLDAFLTMAERTRKWQCPHSMINSSVYSLQVDTFTKAILDSLEAYTDIMEVEISPEAKWRPAGSSGPFQDAGQPFDKLLHTCASCREGTNGGDTSEHAASTELSNGVKVKTEAGFAINLNSHGANIGRSVGGGKPSASSDSDSEEDEMEELRQAARAVQAAADAAKRKRSTLHTEVIEIEDSDDDKARGGDEPSAKRLRQGTVTCDPNIASTTSGAGAPSSAAFHLHPPPPQAATGAAGMYGNHQHSAPPVQPVSGTRPGLAGSNLPPSNGGPAPSAAPPASGASRPGGTGLRFTIKNPMLRKVSESRHQALQSLAQATGHRPVDNPGRNPAAPAIVNGVPGPLPDSRSYSHLDSKAAWTHSHTASHTRHQPSSQPSLTADIQTSPPPSSLNPFASSIATNSRQLGNTMTPNTGAWMSSDTITSQMMPRSHSFPGVFTMPLHPVIPRNTLGSAVPSAVPSTLQPLHSFQHASSRPSFQSSIGIPPSTNGPSSVPQMSPANSTALESAQGTSTLDPFLDLRAPHLSQQQATHPNPIALTTMLATAEPKHSSSHSHYSASMPLSHQLPLASGVSTSKQQQGGPLNGSNTVQKPLDNQAATGGASSTCVDSAAGRMEPTTTACVNYLEGAGPLNGRTADSFSMVEAPNGCSQYDPLPADHADDCIEILESD
ncbi:hypothetical protein CEUSTIGMA_g1480.t1 [Chlamydomonas eustigma]|uniref:SAP domain-containing protein n=1 Tax=Chlamydomonas eustigma TaxID=1157962 RepID=A0A250WTZ8_9CHLO|nr:hypothetical protein CEUSTIGMA_g1480.t1 [Chlamydomonas eustigma]|eukprot:GAX74030.1 hypothetical protein CEUSTIGMA_g1480.t1 [Chlamydomonas eustigma]